MTPPSSDERPLLRCALAAVVVVDLVSFIGFIRDARAAAIGAGAAVGSVVEVLSRPTITFWIGTPVTHSAPPNAILLRPALR